MLGHLLAGSGVLAVIMCLWFGVYYWRNPRVENPDGEARLEGSCGDTMELRLRFCENRVTETSHWTNGCAFSLNCLLSAATLAKGKTPDELLDIAPETLRDAIGGLPTDHMHCAALAVATLKEAVNSYMQKTVRENV